MTPGRGPIVTIIRTDELRLATRRGSVFGPVSFVSDTPLTVIAGAPGSGRTPLLLTLAGRMRPSGGSASVLGDELPHDLRALQRRAAIAGFHEIDDLEDTVTLAQTIAERRAWLAPWWAPKRRASEDDVRAALAPVFAPAAGSAPTGGTLVRDLDELSRARLQLALALLAEPELLVYDGADRLQSEADRAAIWATLARIAATGVRVIASGTESAARTARAEAEAANVPCTVAWLAPAEAAISPSQTIAAAQVSAR